MVYVWIRWCIKVFGPLFTDQSFVNFMLLFKQLIMLESHSCIAIMCIAIQGGRQLPRGGSPTYNFAKFSRKLHEIERIWARGARGARPPKSTTTIAFWDIFTILHHCHSQSIVLVTFWWALKCVCFSKQKLFQKIILLQVLDGIQTWMTSRNATNIATHFPWWWFVMEQKMVNSSTVREKYFHQSLI